MDKRDLALQTLCPIIPIPRFSEFAQSTIAGDRILIASNGTFLEVTRKWGRFVRKIGEIGVVVPFGEMNETTELFTPRLPRQLLRDFNAIAIANSDVEVGASIIWNESTNAFRLEQSKSLAATGGFLHQEFAPLHAGDHLVIDCHSHSSHRAFFSTIDDDDDAHMAKFAYVVGNCDREKQSHAMRLCLKGIFQNYDLPTL